MLFKQFQSYLRPTICLSVPMGLMVLNGFWQPAQAGWNQFDVCISELVNNGVSSGNAKTGCAGALIPKELSQCVSMIRNNAPIDGELALQSCYQVRRPIDLGNCVIDIQNAVLGGYTGPSESTGQNSSNNLAIAAMDSCRLSLSPGRHSECVIAASREGENTAPKVAMDTCLAAEDFPRDLFPTYSQTQPQGQ